MVFFFFSCFFLLFHHLLMSLFLPLPPCFPSPSRFSHFLPSISLSVSLCMIFRNLRKNGLLFLFLFLSPFSSSPNVPFSPSPSLFPFSVSFFPFSPIHFSLCVSMYDFWKFNEKMVFFSFSCFLLPLFP